MKDEIVLLFRLLLKSGFPKSGTSPEERVGLAMTNESE